MGRKDEPPVLAARLLPGGERVAVLGPHCGVEHVYGAAGIVDGGNRHRVGHCPDPASPYRAGGYVPAVEAAR